MKLYNNIRYKQLYNSYYCKASTRLFIKLIIKIFLIKVRGLIYFRIVKALPL
jgi:hypothetical protein